MLATCMFVAQSPLRFIMSDDGWSFVDVEDLWVLDKLILSKRLGYICGPVGVDVPFEADYIVRPCVNALGLGLGACKKRISRSTDDLSVGHFWCEIFEGPHMSYDFQYGHCVLSVEGIHGEDMVHWKQWEKRESTLTLPDSLQKIAEKYPLFNVETIGGKIIECHFRNNPDFVWNNSIFIPVWQGKTKKPPKGLRFVDCPDVHGRIGAFID